MITGGGGGGTSTPAFAFGTAATRPAAAAGNAQTGYFATDTGEVTFSDGAAWHSIGTTTNPTFNVGDPSGSTYTQIGPSGTGLNALYLRGPNKSFQYSSTFALEYGGSLGTSSAGSGLVVKEGTNAKQGVATLVGGTVTVSNTSVTANSRIILTPQDNNTAGALRVSARTAGTSFVITSSNAADTGVVAYQIFEPG